MSELVNDIPGLDPVVVFRVCDGHSASKAFHHLSLKLPS